MKITLSGNQRKHRNKLEIAKDMLAIATVKVRKTRIMYQANLSYRLLEKYLNSLLEGGLMECDDDSFYSITSRGREFVQIYEGYLERRRRISEEVKRVRKDRLRLENMCFNNEGDWNRVTDWKGVLVDIAGE